MRDVIAVFLWMTVTGSGAPPVAFRKIYPPTNDVAVDHRVAIPMRDGVILYADVYRPVKTDKYPVLVSRTPYSTQRYPNAYEEPLFFASRGTSSCFRTCEGGTNRKASGSPSGTISRMG